MMYSQQMENLQENAEAEQEAQQDSFEVQKHEQPEQSVAALAWNSVCDDEDYDIE